MNQYKRLFFSEVCSLESIEFGLRSILKTMPDGAVYAVIISIGGEGGHIYNMTKALHIMDEDSIIKAMSIIKMEYAVFLGKYQFTEIESHLIIKGREFLDAAVYADMKDKNFRNKVTKVLEKLNNLYFNSLGTGTTNTPLNLLKYFQNLSLTVSKGFSLDTPIYLHNSLSHHNNKTVITEFKDENMKFDPTYTHSNSVTVTEKERTVIWKEHVFNNGYMKRIHNGNIYVFYDGELVDIELSYSFANLRKPSKDLVMNNMIGVIDIETYKDGEGNCIPYAAGFKVNDCVKTFYVTLDNADVMSVLMDYLNVNYSGYTFFAHNLDFDGIYILNGLVQTMADPSKVKVVMNDNKFMCIKAPGITILDSLKFIPNSLAEAGKHFQLPVTKGIFPYNFVSKDNLFYTGPKPDVRFYDKGVDYNMLADHFDMMGDTILYLENDLNMLYSIVTILNNTIFDQFHIDITKHMTISTLSFRIYLTKYYKNKYNIKVVEGFIQKDIRSAHYGGLVTMLANKVNDAYFYDMNSQYPSAMRSPMPIGNPTLATNIDLSVDFGFFYADILAPDSGNFYIPHRTEFGIIETPNNKFSGWYFSEELKQAEAIGFKMKIYGGYKFDNSSDVFMNFVDDIYSKRVAAKKIGNTTLSNILKLILNSLYGRTGMNPILTKSRIIHQSQHKRYDVQHTILNVIHLPKDMILIHYDGKINHALVDLFDEYANTTKYSPNATKTSQTSIPLTAAIASYARTSMLPFKSLTDNPWYYSDTDSILMQNPLDDKYVSPDELGKMKLQYKVKQAFFVAPKFYAILLNDNSVIIKTSGVPSNALSLDDMKAIIDGVKKVVKTEVWLRLYGSNNAIQIHDRVMTLEMKEKNIKSK